MATLIMQLLFYLPKFLPIVLHFVLGSLMTFPYVDK